MTHTSTAYLTHPFGIQEFVLHVDDLAFWLFATGVFEKGVHDAAQSIKNIEVTEVPKSGQSEKLCERVPYKRVYFVNCIIIFASFVFFWVRQFQVYYVGCSSVSVTFGDDTWEGTRVRSDGTERTLLYSYFSGEYKIDGKHDGYLRYEERNKEDGAKFTKVVPAEIIYCRKLKSWVFTHREIVKSTSNEIAEEVRIE